MEALACLTLPNQDDAMIDEPCTGKEKKQKLGGHSGYTRTLAVVKPTLL